MSIDLLQLPIWIKTGVDHREVIAVDDDVAGVIEDLLSHPDADIAGLRLDLNVVYYGAGLHLIFSMLHVIRKLLRRRPMAPAKAYELLAAGYDARNEGQFLTLESALFERLLAGASLRDKTVVDVGCGTGRHWPAILSHNPRSVVGYDITPGMVALLREKYPDASVHIIADHRLPRPDESCDVVLSTLTIKHMKDCAAAIAEWSRVLKPNGELVLTEMHPSLANGDLTLSGIRMLHYGHALPHIISIAAANGLDKLLAQDEPEHNGIKVLYGLRLKKS